MGMLKPIWIAPILVLLALVLVGLDSAPGGVPTGPQDVNSPIQAHEQSVASSSLTQMQSQVSEHESPSSSSSLRLCNGKYWESCKSGRFVCPQKGDAYCEMDALGSTTAVKSSSSLSGLPQVSAFRVSSPRAFVQLSCEQEDGRFRSGTGAIVTREGHILTAKHVVQDNTVNSIVVNKCLVYTFSDFDRAPSEFAVYEASTIQVGQHRCLNDKCTRDSGYDAGDFALLKIDALAPRLYGGRQGCIDTYLGSPNIEEICSPYKSELPGSYEFVHVLLGEPRSAEPVTGVGIPLALRDRHVLKRTEGVVRLVTEDYVAADVFVTGGYSGGALLNKNNEVIGLLVSNSETFSTGTTLYAKFPTAYVIPSALFSTELGLSKLTKVGL